MTLPLSLIALAVASFGIGTTEFVIMGLLPEVAADLRVTIPTAGLLIGGYALGVTFGSPLMAALLARVPRKRALLALVSLFTVGNLACALAPSYGLLMAARLLTALCHGTFFGIAAVVATTLVPPKQRSRAVAVVFSGLTLANVLGVPFGTALGQALGWRASFWAIVPIGCLAGVAIWRWVPVVAVQAGSSFLRELRALGRAAVLLPMLTSTLVSASLFATFTYLAPLLETVTGVSPRGVTLVLLVFGLGITAGNFGGGRLADWRQMGAVIGLTGAMTVVLVGLAGLVGLSPAAAAAGVVAWGAVTFACAAPLQTRVVDGAVGAQSLASVLNQSAFNAGNALGAWVGGRALVEGLSYGSLPLVSAGLAGLALTVGLIDATVSRRAAAPVPTPAE